MQITDVHSKLPLTVSEGGGEDGVLLRARNQLKSTNVPSKIINKGHMDVHYHQHYYYNKNASSDESMPTTVSLKRERENNDEHYSETPNASMVTDQPETNDTASDYPSKRIKTEQDNTKTENLQTEVTAHEPSLEKEAKSKHVKGKICKHCGTRFLKRQNKVESGKLPCRTHTSK